MNIAELFVRIRGDTTDLHRKLTDAERAMIRLDGTSKRLDGTMRSATLQTGRLGNQFAGLAGHLTGIHPVIGNVAGVLGNFAVGSALTVGVLGGLAAIALAWDRLTKSARDATKAQDEAVASLLKARNLKALGPGGATAEQLMKAGGKMQNLLAEGTRLQNELDANKGVPLLETMTLDKIAKNQEAIRNVQQAIISARETIAIAVEGAAPKVAAIKDGFNAARDAAEELTLQQQITNLKLKITLEELEKIAALHAEIAGYTQFTGMPNLSMPFEGLDKRQKDQLKELGVIRDDANENTSKLSDAIWGSATQMANQIVGALNIGGGGKGSNLGGALGGTAGFAAGFMMGGPIGGAIGSTIGNIAGSLFGGLFDSNKKEVNANTQALRQNTMALLQNTPSGFKVERGRFDASDIKDLRDASIRYSRRGGAPVMVTP